MSTAKISVALPVYNEADLLQELWDRLRNVADGSKQEFEFVFVDDGSVDETAEVLSRIAAGDARVRVVVFSRNFGHQAACTAGIQHSRGDATILMDSDLQDPPELIPKLIEAWENGARIVLAHRRSRHETGLRAFMTRFFYRVTNYLQSLPIQGDVGVFSLMDRTVVRQISSLPERNRYLPGLRGWVGFQTARVYYDRENRFSGEPKQNFRRLFSYAFDAIFSFSYVPLRLGALIGGTVSLLSITYAGILIAARILGINVVSGFTTTTVAVLSLGGLQLLFIGIVGEYIARMYDELKARPLFIVQEILESSPSGSADGD